MKLDRIIGTVKGYNHEGMGVIALKDQICFVPGVLAGEEVKVRLTGKKKGKVVWGEALEIRNPSQQRQVPPCPHYLRCGGCQLQHAAYPHQLEIKQSIVERAFGPLRRQDENIMAKLWPILPAPQPAEYRNKGIFAVGRAGNGSEAVQIGFYGRQSREIAGHGCPVLFSQPVNGLLYALAFWLEQNKIAVGQGLHHVMIRQSHTTGKIILVLIGEKEPDWLPEFLATFVPKDPVNLPPLAPKPDHLLAGIGWLSAPDKAGPVISGKPKTLWGSLITIEELQPQPLQDGITEALASAGSDANNGAGAKGSATDATNSVAETADSAASSAPLRFAISPEAFFQVNTAQANTLYDVAAAACGLTGKEILWDLYCGSGTISLYVARQAKAVLGIEISEASIKDAWINARINSVHSGAEGKGGGAGTGAISNAGAGTSGDSIDGNNNGRADSQTFADRLCFLAGAAEELIPRLIKEHVFLADQLKQQAPLYTSPKGEVFPPSEDIVELLAGKTPDVVLLDPPSKGAETAVLETILAAEPQRIVYVSCDPATLVRDVQVLIGSGKYEVEMIQPVDMFPQTGHVEAIILMTYCGSNKKK
ncbi:MAG: class I SAM-dependent RNA methyltransferase [Clostridiales bacterium]